MCGRYALAKDPADLAEEFDARDATDGRLDTPEYNVAPTLTIPGVVDRDPRGDSACPTRRRWSGRCGRCVGAWCRRGRRTSRWATG